MIRSIEGVRGIAALMVALYHAYIYAHWGGFPARSDVLRYAWLFVDLFFVVSGFVMAINYGDRLQTGRAGAAYMVRRFFRLYPLHIVTTFTVLAAVISVQTAKLVLGQFGISTGSEAPFAFKFFDPLLLVFDFLLLQGLGIIRMEIHNFPSWSISVEFWMYLLFAVFVLVVRSRLWRIVLSATIVVGCIAWFLLLWPTLPLVEQTLDTRGLGRGMLSFFQGVLVYYLWMALRPGFERLGTTPLTLLQLLAGWAALWLVGSQPNLGHWQLVVPTAFAVLVFVLLPDRGWVARGLMTRPMQWLGVYSYSIYLCHITIMILLDWPGRAVPEPWKHAVGLLYLGLLFGMSMLTYRYIEVPWRERGKRIAARIEQGDPAGVDGRVRTT